MLDTITPLFPGIPGGPELLVILFIAILLFGANKIPKLARSTGQAMGEFQKGREEVEGELEEMRKKGKEGPTDAEEANADTTDADADKAETQAAADEAQPNIGADDEEDDVEAEKEK
ncbi:twin-arginine translocase TatA/TatE family subunit [Haladaptatus sp. ZSTT2]|uniref:twin-arginine translocase TatA/TatE family subunit n=1 Tax=Haladaptatus sp. ZSTT2 TaxID=3120515 RepID=UPI00300F0185